MSEIYRSLMSGLMNFRVAVFLSIIFFTTCVPSSRTEPQPSAAGPRTETTDTGVLKKLGDVPASRGPLRTQKLSGAGFWIYDNSRIWNSADVNKWKFDWGCNG